MLKFKRNLERNYPLLVQSILLFLRPIHTVRFETAIF